MKSGLMIVRTYPRTEERINIVTSSFQESCQRVRDELYRQTHRRVDGPGRDAPHINNLTPGVPIDYSLKYKN